MTTVEGATVGDLEVDLTILALWTRNVGLAEIPATYAYAYADGNRRRHSGVPLDAAACGIPVYDNGATATATAFIRSLREPAIVWWDDAGSGECTPTAAIRRDDEPRYGTTVAW